MTQQYYTVKDLAELLNVTERTVWGWENASLMPSPVRIARTVRWHREKIDEWLKQREATKVFTRAALVSCHELEQGPASGDDEATLISVVKEALEKIKALNS